MDALPAVLLLQVLQFLDHAALHAAEQSSHALLTLTREHELWRALVEPHVACSEALGRAELGKKVACLAQRPAVDDKQLLGGVEAFSSADRPSESPVNTLTSSRCWVELHQLQTTETQPQEEQEMMTLGERVQHRCGCSTGHSCYWSSSASTNENATEFIDYALNGPCVVSAVQIVPYRVFWHPGSPTYAPKRVRFEFFDVDDLATFQQARRLVMRPPVIKPFYASHDYEVQNAMTLQEFELPRKVVASKKTVLRITLSGRHQAQTFELPQELLDAEEDRRPKYYCCLSYVNVCGVPWNPVQSSREDDGTVAAHTYSMSPNLRMAALTGLAVYMTACYEGFIGRTRRWE
ncbi:hypothetical protein PF010_g5606 [Phytophthora fragariae]|uniref:F-box domain-containing protein n=1 Tax=Phytophthora fragariae TaxID=53985 RepID=A0A6G0PG80_9STRA|nr:hypothetical protein PF010_g5606 [Phytophthora fragariae]KAE9245204.1 hypothetical protein PF004_g5340 [Phytophthora fragariae]